MAIVDHESMEDAVYSSDLGSITISADDLMDNRMLHQRAYPVALEDNESMEDPFRSDQSGAAWTYTTTYETHHSPHDPPIFEERLVRYQPNANRDANVPAHHHPEEGYLLRIQRILKNRSLMKSFLRGTCKALMAFFVANGLYGDIIYYHSGTNQYQTTISAGNVAVADSNPRESENFARRLGDDSTKQRPHYDCVEEIVNTYAGRPEIKLEKMRMHLEDYLMKQNRTYAEKKKLESNLRQAGLSKKAPGVAKKLFAHDEGKSCHEVTVKDRQKLQRQAAELEANAAKTHVGQSFDALKKNVEKNKEDRQKQRQAAELGENALKTHVGQSFDALKKNVEKKKEDRQRQSQAVDLETNADKKVMGKAFDNLKKNVVKNQEERQRPSQEAELKTKTPYVDSID